MHLAPIPSFFSESYDNVKEFIDEATTLIHNDQRVVNACRFYAWHAINVTSKQELLNPNFYRDHLHLNLCSEVLEIAKGSHKTKSKEKEYEDGIREKGVVLNALEAALWAFNNDRDLFHEDVLLAVNLGNDTDATAAIYGELTGSMYGSDCIPGSWIKKLFQEEFIKTVGTTLYLKRMEWY